MGFRARKRLMLITEHQKDSTRRAWKASSRAHLGLSISLFSQVDVSDFQDDGAESPHPQELQRTHANRTFSAQALRDWK